MCVFARVKRGRERKGVEDVSTIRERERERCVCGGPQAPLVVSCY